MYCNLFYIISECDPAIPVDRYTHMYISANSQEIRFTAAGINFTDFVSVNCVQYISHDAALCKELTWNLTRGSS